MAIIAYLTALTVAVRTGGLRRAALLFVGVLLVLWLLQIVALARLTDCNLSPIEWAKGVLLFNPDCDASARNVESDLLVGFGFRTFFAAAITILSLPAFVFAYRDAQN